MSRWMCIDFGERRCGIAVTDPLRMIATGLNTVPRDELISFIIQYNLENPIDKIIFGWPLHKDGSESFLNQNIRLCIEILEQKLPNLVFDFIREDFSSVEAKKIIQLSGVKKEKRKDKGLVDKTAAVMLLQKYLGHF